MELLTTTNARLDIEPDDVHRAYAARFAQCSDEQVFDIAARIIAIPKQDPADSFILHAPLELLARRALLRIVPPESRDAVRERMIWVAATYERAGASLEPTSHAEFDSAAAAVAGLADAIEHKDLDATDAAAAWLGRHAATDAVMTLAESLIDSLAAAGHTSIYFSLLARTASNNRSALTLLRPLVREVARLPELRIEWTRDAWTHERNPEADGRTFAHTLATTPRLGLPGSDFVFPTVHQVDNSPVDKGGLARDLIAPTLPANLPDAGAAIVRVATSSMLQDDPKFAPYGWTHCLTLPQGVLGIRPWLSDAARAAAIAATYVVAFRAAEGARDVDIDWRPAPTGVTLPDALDAEPATAASAVFHASDEELDAVVSELAARAGAHEDAHLAKYTLSCFAAGANDTSERRLYLSAAAYLSAWWKTR